MLQYIKKYIKGWVLGIILFLIFISFTFWGVGDIFRSNSGYLLKTGEFKVSREEYLAELQTNINYLNKKKKLDKVELEKVANETLVNMANRNLILNAAKSMDLKVSKKILKEKIIQNELFKDKLNNNFDKVLYENFVKRNFGNEENYLRFLEHQILIEVISYYFEKQINYPENLAKKIYYQLEEKKSFQIASIDKIFLKSKIKDPDNETLENYFNKNKEKYKFDERRSFTYLFLDLDKIKKRIEITEEELLELYEIKKEDFSISEKRKVEQLFFNNKEKGTEILNSLNNKSKFKVIADKEEENKVSYISLGVVEKEQLFDEFADTVFKLNKDEYTKLIKTDIGWHILKVTEIVEKKIKEFDKVKNEIKNELALNKSYDELDILLNEVDDEISAGNSLEEISNKLNLELYKKEFLEKKSFYTSDLPEKLKINSFYEELFNNDVNSDLFIEEIEDGFFIVRVDSVEDKKLKTFEEAYGDVIANVKDEKIDKKINEISKEFNKKINSGEDFNKISDLLNMNSRTTKKLNREDMVNQGFSINFTNKVFESKKNTLQEDKTNEKYNIIKVISDSEVIFNKEKFDETKNNINKIYGIDNFQQITKILEKKYPISINEKMLNEFIDRYQY